MPALCVALGIVGADSQPAFFTPTGYGTNVQTGGIPIKYDANGDVEVPGVAKETREFNGRQYVLEESIVGDVAVLRAWKADEYGNCVFRYSANNFSGPMARSAKMTIVEAEEIVPVGSLDPNHIHLPGIYVDRVCPSTEPKLIDKRVVRENVDASATLGGKSEKSEARQRRERIVRRAAEELTDGSYVNLGIVRTHLLRAR